MYGLSVHVEGAAIAHVDSTCSTAIDGRRAARVVAQWAKRFGLTEGEFQLLWRLRTAAGADLDQTTLAGALAFSPAQISASVERLRVQGHISATDSSDRRRHHWQLTATGRELLDQMLVAAMLRHGHPGNDSTIDVNGSGSQEAAA
jgi:DNA-binding MarR family transcriptional regulator